MSLPWLKEDDGRCQLEGGEMQNAADFELSSDGLDQRGEALLLRSAARLRELQVLRATLQNRIDSAKAAAQRWRQIAVILLAAGAAPFHPNAGGRPPTELLQVLAALELDETKLLTATLRKEFHMNQKISFYREECHALAERESMTEVLLERHKDNHEQLQEDGVAESQGRNQAGIKNATRNAHGSQTESEFSAEAMRRNVLREKFAELEFVGGNLQLESADLLVAEQENIAETRALEQDARSLKGEITLSQNRCSIDCSRAEQLSASLTQQRQRVAKTLCEIQDVRTICASWSHPKRRPR